MLPFGLHDVRALFFLQLLYSRMSLLTTYFPHLTKPQLAQFARLETEFKAWNAQINLVARTDTDNLMERHILHSLGIAKVVQFPAGSAVLPGLPLAIMFPEVKFHLVDSIGKKIRAVQFMAADLGLSNVTAEQTRAEQVHAKFDFVVSRAVARLATFHPWIAHRYKAKPAKGAGLYYLKGGDLTEEIAESGLVAREVNLSDFFQEEFFETKKVVVVPV
jgi:16S rRNA (guanine527-N7)-methyltransferase